MPSEAIAIDMEPHKANLPVYTPTKMSPQYSDQSDALIVGASLLQRVEEQHAPLDKIRIQQLRFGARTFERLRIGNITTIQQLVSCSENDLLKIKQLGSTTLQEIKDKLNSYLAERLRTGDWQSQVTHDFHERTVKTTDRLSCSDLESQITDDSDGRIVELSLLARLEDQQAPLDRISVRRLGLSALASSRLGIANTESIQQLVNCSEKDLLSIKQLGLTILDEIKEKLHSYLATRLSNGDWESQVTYGSQTPIVETSLLERLEEQQAPLDRISVQRLGLSEQACNRLTASHILTIQQLVSCSESDLLKITQLDLIILDEIKGELHSYLATRLTKADWESQFGTVEQCSPSDLEEAPSSLADALQVLFEKFTNQREVHVIKLRYGIDDGKQRTLQEIGQRFGITRERVRQIERKARRKLVHPSRRRILRQIAQPIEIVLQQAGGVLKEQQIAEKISDAVVIGEINPTGATRFIVDTWSKLANPPFQEIGDDIWALSESPFEHFSSVITAAVSLLEGHYSRMLFNKLVTEICKKMSMSEDPTETSIDALFIEACIKVDSQFEISEDGWCTLEKWQRTYVDEIVEVLRDAGIPLHYRQIASGVNRLLKEDQHVSAHNVHAALIRRSDIFVWTGPGMYGLKEWGISRPLYYVDIITDVLESERKVLPTEEIEGRVNKVRPCSSTSIKMFLMLNDRFAEFSPGKYGLVRWLEDAVKKPEMKRGTSFIEQLKKQVADSLSGDEGHMQSATRLSANNNDEETSCESEATDESSGSREAMSNLTVDRTRRILSILREMPPGKYSMVDIIQWLIKKERWVELRHTILGETPSTAPNTLYKGKDICISCTSNRNCSVLLRDMSQEERIQFLAKYRFEFSTDLLAQIRAASANKAHDLLQQLLLDPLHMKFGVSYSLVVEVKAQLLREGTLSSVCKVLRKDHGQYCPFDDVWELSL